MSALLQMVLGLAIVLAAIWGASRLARRFHTASGGGSLMKTVAALSVGVKERVVVVEIGEQWLVLGVAPGRVSPVATLPRGELTQPPAERFDFRKIFKQVGTHAPR